MTAGSATACHIGPQRARIVTEAWGENNLFCPICSFPELTWPEPDRPDSNYSCPDCDFWYSNRAK
ncbi:MAG: DpnI domain-containing protein [Limisphaerales bacterium]